MSVKKLKENFKNEFGGTLRVYDGREKADESATLASIRRNEDAKGGELICSGNKTVGGFEKEMQEVFGIKVQVATPDDWTLVLDGITLSKLKNIPEKTSKADMESLVAYKRRAKEDESAEVEDVEDSSCDEPNMKLIKLRFFTPHLGHMQSTWVDTENEVVKECLKEADGDYDFNTVDIVAEESGGWLGYHEYYLADYRDSNVITVIDENDNKTEYTDILEEKLIVDAGVDLSLYVRENNCEVYGDNEDVSVEGPVPSVLFKKLKENHLDFCEKGLIRTHVKSMFEEGCRSIDDELFLLSYGDIGRGTVNYDIWIKDDEEFDINKLGFMLEDDWWDWDCVGVHDIFATTSVILDFVVYDNKIFNRNGNEFFIPGYRAPGEVYLIRPDMSPAELPDFDADALKQKETYEPVPPKQKTMKDGHEYVDLGLPSGVKWAACNIGAIVPEASGDYFAWGETSPKEEYTEENSLTYGKQMSDIAGNAQYDAARANWGGGWRMPDSYEWWELIDECKWEWVKVNGVEGNKVTGPNGNSIFLPAAGRRGGSSIYGAGGHGVYLMSDPCDDDDYSVFYLGFGSDGRRSYRSFRYFGLSVRPVVE